MHDQQDLWLLNEYMFSRTLKLHYVTSLMYVQYVT